MTIFRFSILLAILLLPTVSAEAGTEAEALLPAHSCGAGWQLDGKIAQFDRQTLSDRIDGEAELFLPYGFDLLAYGRYVLGRNSFDVDLYRMGSSLDAFGMYASYRPDGAEPLRLGGEGAATSSQLLFYQDRYFVRLQSTGDADPGKNALAACAQAVSGLLPKAQGAPGELGLLSFAGIEPASIRYSATSLLGYHFFPRGMTADAAVAGKPCRIFLVLTPSSSEAAKAFRSYRHFLRRDGCGVKMTGRSALTGTDPLYGKVLAEQAGPYVFGLARVKDVAAARRVMEKLRERLGR